MSTPVPASNDATSDSELMANPTSQLSTPAPDEQAAQLAAALHTFLTQQGYPIDSVRLHGVLHQQTELVTLASIVRVLEQLGIDQLP
ncbi:MAG: hypothetical protein ACR2PP_05515, partial [Psychrobacter sp.]